MIRERDMVEIEPYFSTYIVFPLEVLLGIFRTDVHFRPSQEHLLCEVKKLIVRKWVLVWQPTPVLLFDAGGSS